MTKVIVLDKTIELTKRDTCYALVHGRWNSYHCSRPKGNGPGFMFCKMHAKQVEREGWEIVK